MAGAVTILQHLFFKAREAEMTNSSQLFKCPLEQEAGQHLQNTLSLSRQLAHCKVTSEKPEWSAPGPHCPLLCGALLPPRERGFLH